MIRTYSQSVSRGVVAETLDLDTMDATTDAVPVLGYSTVSVMVEGPLVAPGSWEGELEWSPDNDTWTSFDTPVTITGASYAANVSVTHAGWVRLKTTTENGDAQTADVTFVLGGG